MLLEYSHNQLNLAGWMIWSWYQTTIVHNSLNVTFKWGQGHKTVGINGYSSINTNLVQNLNLVKLTM